MNEMLISMLVAQIILFVITTSQIGKTGLLIHLSGLGSTLTAFAVWGNVMTVGEGAIAALFFIICLALWPQKIVMKNYLHTSRRTRTSLSRRWLKK